MPPSTVVIYEQPTNECIRLCLRLEHVFQKAKYYVGDDSVWSARAAIEAMLEIITLASRPDLKTKLSKALASYATPLVKLLNHSTSLPADIDCKKIRRLSEQLNGLISNLHMCVGKIGQSLRENEFIATIQQRSVNVGSTCSFSMPAYHLWLEKPAKIRQQNLDAWLSHFAELKTIIIALLRLTRESANFESINTEEGFFQTNLDSKLSYQMIRIALPTDESIYPEISVGRHRLSIHFYELSTESHSKQINKRVRFELACCRI